MTAIKRVLAILFVGPASRGGLRHCARVTRSCTGLVAAIGLSWGVGWGVGASLAGGAPLPEESDTNAFPDPKVVLAGKVFGSTFEREVYFLKTVRQSYPSQWAPLLAANLLVTDYVVDPDKLERFIREVGEATAGTDDPVAATNLAVVVNSAAFYANTNAFRPLILRATADELLKMGPRAQQALAGAFHEDHYRLSPESLEVLAEAVGHSSASDPKLTVALAAAAFIFATANGGSYPNCTRQAVLALLHQPGGIEAVRQHLNEKEVFDDPVRFQDVVESIVTANAGGLRSDLLRLENATKARRELLKTSASSASAGPYLAELEKLQAQLHRASDGLKTSREP